MKEKLIERLVNTHAKVEAHLGLTDELPDDSRELLEECANLFGLFMEAADVQADDHKEPLKPFVLSGTVRATCVARIEAMNPEDAAAQVALGKGEIEVEQDSMEETFEWDGEILDPVDVDEDPLADGQFLSPRGLDCTPGEDAMDFADPLVEENDEDE